MTPTPTGPRQLARAAANSDADDLLALIGNAGALGWDPLWKALEIIKVAVGGKAPLIATGWVTDDDLDEFGYSANQPDASGADARHARRSPGGKYRTGPCRSRRASSSSATWPAGGSTRSKAPAGVHDALKLQPVLGASPTQPRDP